MVVEGILLYAVFKYRRKPGDGDPHQTHGNTPLEIGWTIIPSIVLIVVAVPTVITIFDNANSPDPDGALQVGVVGEQWWWEFNYPDPADPENTLITANELHIPVNEVVNITLDSRDVLHSFWIPKIAGKVDLVPNNRNTMWIKGEETGDILRAVRGVLRRVSRADAVLGDRGDARGVRRLAGVGAGGRRGTDRPVGEAGEGDLRGGSGPVLDVPYGQGHEGAGEDRAPT